MTVVGDVVEGEGAALLALNNGAVPDVNGLTAQEFAALAAMGRVRVGRLADVAVAGFVLTLPARADYDSLNFRWFRARWDAFLYVDRIVVAPAARGRGIGRALYEDALATARAVALPRVCAEVNVEPPNPGSLAFHAALGFRRVGDLANVASGKTVAMMVCELD